jgi:hypothetical protein
VTTSGALARAGVIVSGAFLASRALGWLRVSIPNAMFGAGPDLDAFYAAFRIPDLVFQLVAAGALGSALVPVVASLLAHDDHARAWRVVSTVADLMLVALLALSLAFAVAAPWLVPLITPGFDVAQTEQTVRLTSHAARADLPRPRRRGIERPQRLGAVRRGRPGAGRLQRGHHRGRGAPRPLHRRHSDGHRRRRGVDGPSPRPAARPPQADRLRVRAATRRLRPDVRVFA